MKKIIIALSFVSLAASFNKANAQCDTIANICAKHIISNFISDGQQYRALLLNSDETAEIPSLSANCLTEAKYPRAS